MNIFPKREAIGLIIMKKINKTALFLHAEYQLYPGYTKFYEENEEKRYQSFSLFTELRLGYMFNFSIRGLPLVLNLQWTVGTSLYENNEPKSFTEIRKQDPIFYLFFPNIYVGFRF